MSWSFSKSGTVSEVVQALQAESSKLSGQSKVEYDDAQPHLTALVQQNFRKQEGATEPKVALSANGSGTSVDGEQRSRECYVTLRMLSLVGVILLLSLVCTQSEAACGRAAGRVSLRAVGAVLHAGAASRDRRVERRGARVQGRFWGGRFSDGG